MAAEVMAAKIMGAESMGAEFTGTVAEVRWPPVARAARKRMRLPVKRCFFCCCFFLGLVSAWALGQTPTPSPPSGSSGTEGDLKTVLAQMDEAADSFKSAQANVELVQFTALVDETSTQSGQVFFRRRGGNMDVALRILKPHPKQVVISGGKFAYYDPKTGQTTERAVGSDNRADLESVMNLGFGGRGRELLKDFEVKLISWEVVDNVNTAKLELKPKSDRLKQFFTRMILWIDPKRDVPLKQQRFQSSGDYDITHYSDIRLPGRVSDGDFRLKKAGGAP